MESTSILLKAFVSSRKNVSGKSLGRCEIPSDGRRVFQNTHARTDDHGVLEISRAGALFFQRSTRKSNPRLAGSRPAPEAVPRKRGTAKGRRSQSRISRQRAPSRSEPRSEAPIQSQGVLTNRISCCRSRSTMSCTQAFRFRSERLRADPTRRREARRQMSRHRMRLTVAKS